MRTDRAETIFRNGVLWTGIDGPRDATALAVAGGRITAVGADDDVMNLRGRTRTWSISGGQTLAPGIRRRARAHLEDRSPADDAAGRARRRRALPISATGCAARARRFPPGAWLQGRGYNEARFADGRGPTRADLDAVVERPARRPHAHLRAHHRLQQPGAGAGGHRARHGAARPAAKSIATTAASRPACFAKRRWAWCCARSRRPRRTSTPR